jgi:hypothetical protein
VVARRLVVIIPPGGRGPRDGGPIVPGEVSED